MAVSNVRMLRAVPAGRRIGPLSAFQPDDVTHDWRGEWKNKDAWVLREFAQLCCGWVPAPPEMWIARPAADSANGFRWHA